MTNSEDLICEYDCCKLILEMPITLPCGSTLCLNHLKELNDRFACYFCKEEHLKPSNGFFVNKTINKNQLIIRMLK